MSATPATAVAQPSETDTRSSLAALLAEPAARAWYRRTALWISVVILALAGGAFGGGRIVVSQLQHLCIVHRR